MVYGVEHEPDRLYAAYVMAAAMLLTGLFGAAPAIYQAAMYFAPANDNPRIEVWSLLLAAATGLQCAYGVYLLQAPDWITAKIAAAVTLALSALYAAVLAAVYFSASTGPIVSVLQIFSYHADRRAAGWCFILLLMSGMIAFFGGRFALDWQQEETEMELGA